MSVSDIRTEFKEKAHHLGHRDCTVMAVSALTGYFPFKLFAEM